jgi:hypothetical protein
MKRFDDFANVAVGEHGIIGRQSETFVEEWMVIEDARLGAAGIGSAVAARMRQLQTYQQSIDGAGSLFVFGDEGLAQTG